MRGVGRGDEAALDGPMREPIGWPLDARLDKNWPTSLMAQRRGASFVVLSGARSLPFAARAAPKHEDAVTRVASLCFGVSDARWAHH